MIKEGDCVQVDISSHYTHGCVGFVASPCIVRGWWWVRLSDETETRAYHEANLLVVLDREAINPPEFVTATGALRR